MKRARKTAEAKEERIYRTAIVPVTLRSCDYQRAHEAAHKSALIWNQLVKFQKNHWNTFKTDPGIKVLRHFVCSLDPSLLELHATRNRPLSMTYSTRLPRTGRTARPETKRRGRRGGKRIIAL